MKNGYSAVRSRALLRDFDETARLAGARQATRYGHEFAEAVNLIAYNSTRTGSGARRGQIGVGAAPERDLSMFPLQVRSVSGAEMLRKVRTSCGLFRRSTHMVRKSGPRPYVLQAGGHRFDPGRLHCCKVFYR